MKLIALTIALLTLSCGLDPNDLAPSTKGLETYFSDRNVSAGHLSGFVESQGVNGRKATNKLADNTGKAVVKADETTSKYFSDRNISAGDMQNFENKVASDTEMGAMDTKGYFKSKYKAIVIGDRDERTAINEDRRRLDELESRASTSEGRLSSAESRIAAEEAKSAAQAVLIDQMKLATELRFALTDEAISKAEQDAKDYADDNDTDSVFDPSGLQAALDELEDVVIPALEILVGDNAQAIVEIDLGAIGCSIGSETVSVISGGRLGYNGNSNNPLSYHHDHGVTLTIPTVTCGV